MKALRGLCDLGGLLRHAKQSQTYDRILAQSLSIWIFRWCKVCGGDGEFEGGGVLCYRDGLLSKLSLSPELMLGRRDENPK